MPEHVSGILSLMPPDADRAALAVEIAGIGLLMALLLSLPLVAFVVAVLFA